LEKKERKKAGQVLIAGGSNSSPLSAMRRQVSSNASGPSAPIILRGLAASSDIRAYDDSCRLYMYVLAQMSEKCCHHSSYCVKGVYGRAIASYMPTNVDSIHSIYSTLFERIDIMLT
jgi:hypothetical protein